MYLRKSLGQNFLINESIASQIIEHLNINSKDTILEIGPGHGILTKYIIEKLPLYYFCVEIDERMVKILSGKYRGLKILNENFLDFNFENNSKWATSESKKIVSNMPYYLTSPIFEKIISLKKELLPEFCVFTVQREYADRLLPDSKLLFEEKNKINLKIISCMAIFVNNKYEVKKLFNISRNNFFPRPNVDSAVIKLIKRKKNIMQLDNENKNFYIIRKIFSIKRKKIINSIEISLGIKKNEIMDILNELKIDFNLRPEDLTFFQWENLSNYILKKINI